ncbi:protein Niban 1a [Hypomesus transpacificus]|uniref:protein Niban 1a n=1 Tax=Hypomesus transpacificus TaxID=137520 RepID=UPI001F0772FC|nr:protein Niban 1a [Hypomesus transpacificus]
MGISASSLLDESKSNYLKGRAESYLQEFSPHYRRQYSVASFSKVQEELQHGKTKIAHLLLQRAAPEEGAVLYEDNALYFDENRKWKERYMVVRANYCLECHDSFESFMKGVLPSQRLLPTGGAVLTTEEKYMAMVDKCFPEEVNNLKEDFAPPLSSMPGQFPVYLRLPYRRDSYFCFRQEARQTRFLSVLSDCIRHQNQDFLKKKTCEVEAFLKAVQLYRQEKGQYGSWDMLIGSDVRVLANLVMEDLLPSLTKDMLPRLKSKKTERKRVWFATVEAAYILVQQCLLEGLSALKEECRTAVHQQEVLMHSDMDQILSARTMLEGKLRASVLEPAEKFCLQNVQPYLASVLEELMGPISSGFQEAQEITDSELDQLCQDFAEGGVTDELKQAMAVLSKPSLLGCYQKISSLQEKLQHLQEHFGFSSISSLIHSTQIDLQQLMENAAYTFEQLLYKAKQENPESSGSAMEKARLRVLKQYNYDSSTVRKKIFQDALMAITLPYMKKNLASTCKTELQGLEQYIFADHSNFLHVENVYEGILIQTLDKEVSKVVKEAAILKKHNLLTESRDLLSQSSRSSLSTPPVSTPSSPAWGLGSPQRLSRQPPSPLAENGLSLRPEQADAYSSLSEEGHGEAGGMDASDVFASDDVKVEASLVSAGAPEQKGLSPAEPGPGDTSVPAGETPAVPEPSVITGLVSPSTTDRLEAVMETVALESKAAAPTSADSPDPSPVPSPDPSPEYVPMAVVDPALEQTVTECLASLTVTSAGGEVGIEAEAEADAGAEEAGAEAEAGEAEGEAVSEAGEEAGAVEGEAVPEAGLGEGEAESEWESIPDSDTEAPSSGEQPVTAAEEADLAAPSSSVSPPPSSPDAPADSDSAPSDTVAPGDDVTEDAEAAEVKKEASSGDKVVPVTSDPDAEARVSESQTSAEPQGCDPPPEPVVGLEGDSSVSHGGLTNANPIPEPEARLSVEVASDTQASVPAEPTQQALEAEDLPGRALDCIQEIRDLVVEVIEVEEMVQHYPDAVQEGWPEMCLLGGRCKDLSDR